MGQCSTLPSEGRTASSSKGANMGRDDGAFQSQTENEMNHLQTRNPEGYSAENLEPMDEDNPRDGIPQPPDVAIKTRCYKLNLDSGMNPPPSTFLGPFMDLPPPLTCSVSNDSSVSANPTQVAITTAKIFRGISIAKDGTILSQNARAMRSNRGAKNRRGEKSRQATKIEKAKDLVEESILTGKAPDSDEPANMLSLVIMGEYDDMKYLVRDGSKKLREASELPDESLFSINRIRGGIVASQSMPSPLLSPRKRGSPHYVGGQRAAALHTPNKSRSIGAPPKLKSHPRDRPSTRKHSEEKGRRDPPGFLDESEEPGHQSVGNGDGDWSHLSFSRGFHSFWNCGGTGEETGTSPTQIVSPRDGKPHSMGVVQTPYRPVFEGRDASYGQARE